MVTSFALTTHLFAVVPPRVNENNMICDSNVESDTTSINGHQQHFHAGIVRERVKDVHTLFGREFAVI
jgi:hypothetical protein